METNPVVWFEIYVQDMERARRFYEQVFEVQLQRLPSPDLEMWAFPMDMAKHGAGGALVRVPGVPSGGSGTLVYFGSADCAVEEARIVQAGGRIMRPKTSIGQYGHIVLAFDPDGNLFGLHSRP
jgi:predicted enzyme related to lactoylglutathione lyase